MKTRSLLLLVVLMGACASPGSDGPITEADAIQLVLDQDERFADLAAQDPDLIGQAGWYLVESEEGGWTVTVRIGWGDCPAGCISEHRWVYAVSSDGTVSLTSEDGDEIPDSALSGRVSAGPTCPVVTNPPDPNCADRPVEGAELIVEDLEGTEVARATSDAQGQFSVAVEPGSYRVVPQPVDGLMGTAAPVEVQVVLGEPAVVEIVYDTGMR
jgi:hypothetical protein